MKNTDQDKDKTSEPAAGQDGRRHRRTEQRQQGESRRRSPQEVSETDFSRPRPQQLSFPDFQPRVSSPPKDDKETSGHSNGHRGQPDEPPCCREKGKQSAVLAAEKDALQRALRSANQALALKEEELTVRVAELDHSYNSSLSEMRGLLTTQRRLGDRWKGEMEMLTKRFETKVRALGSENRDLRSELERVRAELEDKTVEAYEAKEMNGIYSAKLTKLDRKFKKLRDEEEESYMEMTF